MKFIIAIEPGTETSAFGVVVPDLPGCFSAGDTLDKAVDNAREAIDLWCQTVIEDGGDVPVAKTLAEHHADPDFVGWIWAVVEVPVERYFGPAEKLNITLPRLLLAKIDEYARAHGETRSGFLADAARMAMR
jgi:predicted RNase H-like HicB family nuclease